MKITQTQIDRLKSLYPDVKPDDRVVFLGYDPREPVAYMVAKHSIQRRSPNVKVFPLITKELRQAGVFWRPSVTMGNTGQQVDVVENRPFSVDFSFTRFLTPIVAKALGITGWVIFADCDFLFLTNLNELFDSLEGSSNPVACVKHDFKPTVESKMDGVLQNSYDKKLWSSFMCFNTESPYLEGLTVGNINRADGLWLHKFLWLPGTDCILGLGEEYNYIPDHSKNPMPKIIHFTEKAPWFKGENQLTGNTYSTLWWYEVASFKEKLGSNTSDMYERFWE